MLLSTILQCILKYEKIWARWIEKIWLVTMSLCLSKVGSLWPLYFYIGKVCSLQQVKLVHLLLLACLAQSRVICILYFRESIPFIVRSACNSPLFNESTPQVWKISKTNHNREVQINFAKDITLPEIGRYRKNP